MKNSLYLIALIPCFVFAQAAEYGDFKIMNTEIIYQKVFIQDSATTEKLTAFLKTLSTVSNVEATADGVQADLKDFVVDFKKFNFSQVAVPTLIQTGRYSGKIKIDGKAGKYRVSIKSMTVMAMQDIKRL